MGHDHRGNARRDVQHHVRDVQYVSQLLHAQHGVQPEHLQHVRADVSEQTDMALPLAGSRVNRAVAMEAAHAAELLMRLSPAPDAPAAIEGYRRAFEAKYGDEQEVPILALLDPVTGLGPPNHGPGASGAQNEERHHFLRSLALDAIRDGRTVVDLDEAALRKLETWPVSGASAPASLDIAVFVVARSAQALDAGDFQLVVGPNLGGQSAGRNLGRFADLLGPPAEEALRSVADGEVAVRPGRLTAEIVYLPRRTRSANVVIRPMVRDGEIVLGTTPESTRTIPLDELVVGLDDDGRFRVRWPARDLEVVPCTGHMLTTTQAPPAIRLLDDISRDRQPQLGAAPWASVADLPFLPRVQSGRVVLSPAMWTLGSDVRPDTLAAWRKRWLVPRHVYLASGDNRLLLDLADLRQAGQLHAEIDKRPNGGRVFLQEALPGPEHAWLPGPQGRYVSEFVVPVVLDAAHAAPVRPSQRRSRVVRTSSPLPEEVLRPPGSDWLYAKLYHPPRLGDHLVAGPVRDLCRDMTERGWAERWFFLRYHDSSPHLRLRLHGDPRTLSAKVLPELLAWANSLTGEGLCERFAVDTYEREIERYGGPLAMPWAESLFAADSHAVAELLALLRDTGTGTGSGVDTDTATEADGKEADSGRLDRTLLAVRSVDELLAGLGFDESARARWCRGRIDRAGRSQQRAVGLRYRRHAADLRRLLADDDWLADRRGGPQALAVLATLRREAAAAAAAFADLRGRGELWQPMDRLAGSFVHMHCNRLLVSGRDEEIQVIGLLQRAGAGLLHAPRPAGSQRSDTRTAPETPAIRRSENPLSSPADDPRLAEGNCVDAAARPL
ncbi:lantibiotic dehydratase [Streptodolium elevatio]